MIKKLSALALLLALTACFGGDDAPDTSDQPAPPKKEQHDSIKEEVAKRAALDNLICPQVAILEKAGEIFDYGGEQPDPSQLVAKARMKTITGDCAYQQANKEDGKPSGIDIAFTVHIVAGRGPRLGSGQVNFPYFIGIVDPSDKILSRQTVTAHFSFDGADKVANLDEPLHVFIPLPEADLIAGPDYRVLVGFKKTGN